MSENVKRSVKGIVNGGILVSSAAIVGSAISFLGKVLITRTSSPEIFGIYSLFVSIVSLVYIVSSVGLPTGATRYIALYLGKELQDTAWSVMHRTTKLALGISLVAFAVFYATANMIGSAYFANVDNFGLLLRIALISVPFYTFLDMSVGVARGYGDAKPKVIFQDIMRNVLFVAALVAISFVGITTTAVMMAYSASLVLTSIIMYIYMSARYSFKLISPAKADFSMKEVLVFSMPMAILPVMSMVLNSMDTIMIGFYMEPDQMGYYNASTSLSKFLKPIIMSVIFLFLPIATSIYAKNNHDDLKHVYQVITKWIYLLLFPCIAVLMVFPVQFVSFIFGAQYAGSANLLQILLLGNLSMIIWSMNTVMLTASGMTREIMVMAVISVLTNLVLNIILIPKLGTIGAAAATMLSTLSYDTMVAIVLYRRMRIQPFTWDYLRCMLATCLAGLAMLPFKSFAATSMLYTLTIPIFVYIVVLIFLLAAFKGFTRFDLIMLDMFEERLGRKFMFVRKLVSRFVAD